MMYSTSVKNKHSFKYLKSILVIAGITLAGNACLAPEDTPPPPAVTAERNYLLPINGDGQIWAFDIYHPENKVFVENAGDLSAYQLSTYSVTYTEAPSEKYYSYFVYAKNNDGSFWFQNLWPTHDHSPRQIVSDLVTTLCTFGVNGGSNLGSAGSITYTVPGDGFPCDDVAQTYNAGDPSADYPLNNIQFSAELPTGTVLQDPQPALQADATLGPAYYANFFAILPNRNRVDASSDKLLGRMVADTSTQNIYWFAGDTVPSWYPGAPPTATPPELLINTSADYSYLVHPGNKLIIFLVDNNVYVFNTTTQLPNDALAASNILDTIVTTPTPNVGDFFHFNSDRVYYFNGFKVNFIRIDQDYTIYPPELLADLTNANVSNLFYFNSSINYLYLREELTDGTGYNLVAIDLAADTRGDRHFIAKVSANALIKVSYDHVYIRDDSLAVHGIYDAALDYATGSQNLPVDLGSAAYVDFVINDFTPSDPGPLHYISVDATTDPSLFSLNYVDLASGDSLYLGDMAYVPTADSPTPIFNVKYISRNILLIKAWYNQANGSIDENGVAVARSDSENTLTPFMTDKTHVTSLR